MKKFKILLLFAATSLFVACEDAIDISQPGEFENPYESLEDMQKGLNGTYYSVSGENHIIFSSIFTDEVKLGVANGGQGIIDGGLSFTLNNTSDDAASIWQSNYYLINNANRLIEGAKNIIPETEEDIERYNTILAQAHFLRAFGHFQIISFFSPNMADDNALGAILMDYVPVTTDQSPRRTNGEIYAFIESDLDFADANLIESYVTDVYVGKYGVTKSAILAFRARMAAYREKYDLAKSYVDQLGALPLAAKGSASSSPYVNMFTPDNDIREVIWKLDRAAGGQGNFVGAWSSVNSTVKGSPFFEVSTSLWNALNPLDIRRQIIVDKTSVQTNYKIKPVGKYANSEDTNLLGDIKVFRNSEMYLIRAEYYASVSDFVNVANQINTVRRVRFGTPTAGGVADIAVPATQQDAWAAILRERRVELAFEGHRYVDIRRLGKKANLGVERAEEDFSFNNQYSLDLNDHRWTLPIPQPEQSANPNIQQNPEYGQ